MSNGTTALRISRILSIVATLLLVVILAYAGTALYYASHLPPPKKMPTTASVEAGNTLRLATGVNLTNPGPFSLTGITLDAHLELPGGTPWLETTSGPSAIGPYATGSLPLTLNLPLGTLDGAAASLLVNDTQLPYQVWSNGTYAGFGTWAADVETNYSWGAPFEGLSVVLGAPALAPNGTIEIPFAVAFANHAPFGLAGAFQYDLKSSSGAVCDATALPVNAPPGDEFSSTSTAYLSAACAGDVTTYTASWTGDGWSVTLPGVSVR